MAVVKKHQEGGKAEKKKQSLQDFLVSKLNETKFTSKGEALAREAASNFIKLHDSGNFDEVYSIDPITKTYNVNVDKIKDESLKGIDWSGSKDAINKNIFGQFTGSGDEKKKFNSLIASWVGEYKSSPESSSIETPQTEGFEKDIPELSKYMVKHKYGGNEDTFISMFDSITDDDIRKNKVIEAAKENVDQYLKDYEANKGRDKFSNVENILKLKESLNTGD